jgi:hypothetical protein
VSLIRAVHNGVDFVDHRFFQPGLYVCRLLCFAFNDYLIVTHENRHCFRTLAPAFPQQGQRQLQAISPGSLDRSIEAVGQLLNIRTTPAE